MVRITLPTTTTMKYEHFESFGNASVVDKVPQDVMHLIDEHWYQFPPMDPIWHKILIIFLSTIGILSFFGNALVIYIFTTTKALRTPSNLLILNLAFSDFGIMFCLVPAMIYNSFHESWSLGSFACDLYGMTGSLFGNSSIWTMVMIALDRYNVIVNGLSAKVMTVKTVLYRICFIWMQAFLWTVLPVFGWNRYVPEGNMTACGTDYLTKTWASRSYILAYSIFVYFSPLLIIIYAYYFIVKTVSHHEEAMREQAKKMNVTSLRTQTESSSNTSVEIKLAKVALMTISLWFIAWTPYLIINYSGIFELLTISPLFTIWGSVFAKTNCVYNPIIYAISHPKYRKALKTKMPFLVCGKEDIDGSDSGSTTTGATHTT